MPSSSSRTPGTRPSSSSQAASGGFKSTTRESVDPSIARDLEDQEACSFDRLLEVFLRRCRRHTHPNSNSTSDPRTPNLSQSSDTPKSSPGSDKTEKVGTTPPRPGTTSGGTNTTPAAASEPPGISDFELLNACLSDVLPLSNDTGFRALLNSYCTVGGRENDRYKPFSHMVNYALEALTRVDNSHIRPPSSNEILFHVNDPRKMEGFKKDSNRVPDVNIVPLTSAKRVHNLPGGSWSDLRGKSHLVPPEGQPFGWRDVLGVVEFKRIVKSIKLELPESYEISPHTPISPRRAQSSDASSGSQSTTHSVAPSSVESNSNSIQDVAEQSSWPTTATSVSTKRADVPPTINLPAVSGEGDATSMEHAGLHSQKKNYPANHVTREAATQCGSYAIEMLNCSPGRSHAIALVIVDQYMWTWWYDRQGAIQSTGIDILKDLPRFLVLLLAFQRFTLADWGYNTELDPLLGKLPTTNEQGDLIVYPKCINIQLDSDMQVMIHPREIIHRTYSLIGRGTYVIGATHSTGMESSSAVAKMSWPDKRRTHEKDIIDCARGNDKTLSYHLPAVIAHRDGYDTEVIREQLGIATKAPRPSRVFRIIIFERLFPIIKLSSEEFVAAWIQCIKCHFLAWPRVQHRDLSLNNLMYRTRGDQICGVVNDWDLSFAMTKSSTINDFTATVPFMALELLYRPYPIEHRYDHDLESFMWIAVWVSLSNKDGTDSPPAELGKWCNGDKISVYQEKMTFILGPDRRPMPLEAWRSVWNPVVKLMAYFRREWLARVQDEVMQKKSNDEHLRSFLRILEENLRQGYQFPNTPMIPGLNPQ